MHACYSFSLTRVRDGIVDLIVTVGEIDSQGESDNNWPSTWIYLRMLISTEDRIASHVATHNPV